MIVSTLLCLDIMVIVSNLIPFIMLGSLYRESLQKFTARIVMLGSLVCNFSKFHTALTVMLGSVDCIRPIRARFRRWSLKTHRKIRQPQHQLLAKPYGLISSCCFCLLAHP